MYLYVYGIADNMDAKLTLKLDKIVIDKAKENLFTILLLKLQPLPIKVKLF